MASDVWCGGYGCREMALGGGEGALLAVPRGTERHLQGLRGCGGWYRYGHEGRRGNMGSGRPEDDREEGEIWWSPAEKVPRVLAVDEGDPVGYCSTTLVEEKEEGEIWSPGYTEDAPVKGAGPSTKTATHEQLTRPSWAMTLEDTPMARKLPAVYCGRPARRVARRTLPMKGSPIKKRKAGKQEGAELEGGGEIVEDEAAAVRGTVQGGGKMGFCKGDQKVSLEASRRLGLCRRWDGGCRDGHGCWRGQGVGGEGETQVPRKKRVVWDMVETRIAARTPPFPLIEGDQLIIPGVVAGEERGSHLLQAEEKVVLVGEILSGKKTPASVSYLSLPDDSRSSSECRDDGCWRSREDSSEGEKPVPWFARRTLPANIIVPTTKVAAGNKQNNWRDAEDAPVKVAGTGYKGAAGILPVAREGACPAVYCGRPVRRVARKTMQMDGPPLKMAPSTCCHRQEPTVFKGGAAGMLPQQCCRSVDAYEVLNKVGAGSYGVVFRARDRETGDVVALKKMDLDETAIREISILASLRLHHPGCIVGFRGVVFDHVRGPEAGVYMVMEYAEFDLRRVIQGMKQPFDESGAKFLMHQLLQAVQCIHGCGVLHRDLKTSNVLVTPSGELKVCDFGLSRRCIGGIGDRRPYTNGVGTLWYMAPELLLKSEKGYSAAIDMWSAGCIMAQLLRKAPLFPGRNELDQLHEIFGVLGTPDEGIWPGFVDFCAHINADFAGGQPSGNRLKEKLPPSCLSESGYDLLVGLLTYDPNKRLTADQAVNHRWFRELLLPTQLRFD